MCICVFGGGGKGQVFGLVVKTPVEMHMSLIVLGFDCRLMQNLEDSSDGPSDCVVASRVGDLG